MVTDEQNRERVEELLAGIQLDEREQRLYDLAIAGKKWCSLCGKVLETDEVAAYIKGVFYNIKDDVKGNVNLMFCDTCQKSMQDNALGVMGGLKVYLYDILMDDDAADKLEVADG